MFKNGPFLHTFQYMSRWLN